MNIWGISTAVTAGMLSVTGAQSNQLRKGHSVSNQDKTLSLTEDAGQKWDNQARASLLSTPSDRRQLAAEYTYANVLNTSVGYAPDTDHINLVTGISTKNGMVLTVEYELKGGGEFPSLYVVDQSGELTATTTISTEDVDFYYGAYLDPFLYLNGKIQTVDGDYLSLFELNATNGNITKVRGFDYQGQFARLNGNVAIDSNGDISTVGYVQSSEPALPLHSTAEFGLFAKAWPNMSFSQIKLFNSTSEYRTQFTSIFEGQNRTIIGGTREGTAYSSDGRSGLVTIANNTHYIGKVMESLDPSREVRVRSVFDDGTNVYVTGLYLNGGGADDDDYANAYSGIALFSFNGNTGDLVYSKLIESDENIYAYDNGQYMFDSSSKTLTIGGTSGSKSSSLVVVINLEDGSIASSSKFGTVKGSEETSFVHRLPGGNIQVAGSTETGLSREEMYYGVLDPNNGFGDGCFSFNSTLMTSRSQDFNITDLPNGFKDITAESLQKWLTVAQVPTEAISKPICELDQSGVNTDGPSPAPSIRPSSQSPTASVGTNSPTASGGTNSPTASGGTNSPTASGGTNSPTASGGTNSPTVSGGTNSPTINGGTNSPTANGGTNSPTTGGTSGSNSGGGTADAADEFVSSDTGTGVVAAGSTVVGVAVIAGVAEYLSPGTLATVASYLPWTSRAVAVQPV